MSVAHDESTVDREHYLLQDAHHQLNLASRSIAEMTSKDKGACATVAQACVALAAELRERRMDMTNESARAPEVVLLGGRGMSVAHDQRINRYLIAITALSDPGETDPHWVPPHARLAIAKACMAVADQEISVVRDRKDG